MDETRRVTNLDDGPRNHQTGDLLEDSSRAARMALHPDPLLNLHEVAV